MYIPKSSTIKFAGPEEEEVAKILEREKIEYEYSVRFNTVKIMGFDEKGNLMYPQPEDKNYRFRHTEHYREVDFFLKEKIKVFWCHHAIQAIEVKSSKDLMGLKSWFQRRELRDSAGVDTFVSLPEHIRFWKNFGFRELRDGRSKVIINEENIENQKKKLARILMENTVRFEANVPIKIEKITYNKKQSDRSENKYPEIISGNETIVVDFFFHDPIKIFWSTHPVRAIIVADELDLDILRKRRSLELKGIPTFIALKQYIAFWKTMLFRVKF